ncbi:MAG: hypothetical protein IPK44_01620 [Candidatus Accumulibacter sp.]|uniref:hypothetical protein n=1 Tax=Accumulibacter sp. TaxID=2053492 RepID=UPI002590D99C|nr:hypothetical protein [Accumulibacter sp.]MBK8113299.1 hypothetical protein [Accumulibacter sp.]
MVKQISGEVEQLKEWMALGLFKRVSGGTYDATHTSALTSAQVVWPDGSAGVYTSLAIDALWGKVTSWKVTHAASGRTLTQPAMTLDANGNPTMVPDISVAGV